MNAGPGSTISTTTAMDSSAHHVEYSTHIVWLTPWRMAQHRSDSRSTILARTSSVATRRTWSPYPSQSISSVTGQCRIPVDAYVVRHADPRGVIRDVEIASMRTIVRIMRIDKSSGGRGTRSIRTCPEVGGCLSIPGCDDDDSLPL